MDNNLYQILQQWHKLYKSGAITEEEFTKKKKNLLGEKNEVENFVSEGSGSQTAISDNPPAEPKSEIKNTHDSHEKTDLPENELMYPESSRDNSWFNKNKTWIIILAIAIVLVGIWLLFLEPAKTNQNISAFENDQNVPSAQTDQNIQTIKDLVATEQNRDFNSIDSYYSPNMIRYWDLNYPTTAQLSRRYNYLWNITLSSSEQIEKIEKAGENTYDLYTNESYTNRKGQYRSIFYIIRYVFDNNGKIIECYGLGK